MSTEDAPSCSRCASTEWRDVGQFVKHQPYRVFQQYRCDICGLLRDELLHEARPASHNHDHCPTGKTRYPLKKDALTVKTRYPLKKDALTVKNKRLSRRTGRGNPVFLREYPCNRCNGWHLTHQEFDPAR